MGTDSELGPIVFTDPHQIRLMETMKERYKRAFNNQPGIELAHQRTPELLNITRQEEAPYFFWMSIKQFGHLPKKLEVDQLDVDYFREETAAYSSSTNGNLTDDLIASGMRYIEEIEGIFLERKTHHPFVNIHRPDYYLILAVSERIKTLCKTAITPALISEYRCLEKFLDSLTEIVNTYFPASFFQQRQAFHAYLEGSVKRLKTMQQRAYFEIDRSAISEQIATLKRHLENYQGKLALFLSYCITDTELSNALSLGQLETGESLPISFTSSPLYRELNQRLQQLPSLSATSDICLSEKTAGLSQLLCKRHKQAPEAIHLAFRSYQQLLTMLSISFSLANKMGALSQYAQWRGEYEMVHDKTLSLLLRTYLKLVHAFTHTCQRNMDNINEQNTAALIGHEKFTGPATNGKRAARITKSLTTMSEQMQNNCDSVKDKIKKIKKENSKTLFLKRNTLLADTEQLLTILKENAILSESAELLTTLHRRCKTDSGKIVSFSDSCHQIHEATKNNRKEISDVQHTVRKKTMASTKITTPSEEILERAARSVTLTQRQIPIIVRESPVAAIYRQLERYPEAQVKATFDEKVAALHRETDVIFPELLQKIQRIYAVHSQLVKKLEALKSINSITHQHRLETITVLLNQLKETIANTTYAGASFESFNFISRLPHLHTKEKTKHLSAILRILTPYYPSPETPPDNRFNTPVRMEAYNPLHHEAIEKSEPTLRAFRELLSTISQTHFPLDMNLVGYYESAIDQEKCRLLALKNNAEKRTTQNTTIKPNHSDSSSNKTTCNNLRQQKNSEILSSQTNEQKSSLLAKPNSLENSRTCKPDSETNTNNTYYSSTPQPSANTENPQPLTTHQSTRIMPTPPVLTSTNAAASAEELHSFVATEADESTLSPDGLAELTDICNTLRTSDDPTEIESNLKNLYQRLHQDKYDINTYCFGLFGGRNIKLGDGTNKKVTETAYQMINYYENHIEGKSLELTQVKDHIQSLLTIPDKSAKKFFTITCCGVCLFQPRHSSMQARYEAMATEREENQSALN